MAGPRSAIASASPGTPRLFASALARIRLSHVWATTAIVVPVLLITATPLAAIDLTYHLRAGDVMLDTHAIMRTDVFTATAYGRPWLNQQWLAEIVMTTAFRLGGWFGLVALRALLMALVLAFVFLACRAAGAATRRAAWLTLVLTGTPVQWLLVQLGRAPEVTPAQVHLFTVLSWILLALDALLGLLVLRGRWHRATALDRLPPTAPFPLLTAGRGR
jgi:hypothetical protein